MLSTLFFSPTDRHPSQTAHSDRRPCKGSTLGRFLVNFWSVLMTKTNQKPTENRLKTDPPQDPDGCLPLRRGEGLWLKYKSVDDTLWLADFQGKPPGLIRLALTVLLFWSGAAGASAPGFIRSVKVKRGRQK